MSRTPARGLPNGYGASAGATSTPKERPVTDWKMAHFDEIAALGDRREALSKLQPKCPSCGHEQVQLVQYIDVVPAHWKCRVCKTRFERDL